MKRVKSSVFTIHKSLKSSYFQNYKINIRVDFRNLQSKEKKRQKKIIVYSLIQLERLILTRYAISPFCNSIANKKYFSNMLKSSKTEFKYLQLSRSFYIKVNNIVIIKTIPPSIDIETFISDYL